MKYVKETFVDGDVPPNSSPIQFTHGEEFS